MDASRDSRIDFKRNETLGIERVITDNRIKNKRGVGIASPLPSRFILYRVNPQYLISTGIQHGLNAASPKTSSIITTCKQTRFHVRDDKDAREIDIEDLNITIVPIDPNPSTASVSDATKSKPAKSRTKSKTKNDGIEILSIADLHLNASVHSGFVERNSTGTSTILRAIVEKLIPGIHDNLRVSILQHIEDGPVSSGKLCNDKIPEKSGGNTILKLIEPKHSVFLLNMKVLSHALEETEDPWGPRRATRQLRHEELERELFLWMQARKDLKIVERRVSESVKLHEKSKDEGSPEFQEETQGAVDLLNELRCQYEAMKIIDIEAEARRSLSGGWRMRCMFAGILIQKTEIMILDKPTYFLNLLGVVWLENCFSHLRKVGNDRIMLFVFHDRVFLNNVCEETVILKEKTLSYFKGNLSAYEENLGAQKLFWGRMKEAQDHQIAHMEASIRDNIKMGRKTGDDGKLRMAKSRQNKVDERIGVQPSQGTVSRHPRATVGYYSQHSVDELKAVGQSEPGETGLSLISRDANRKLVEGEVHSLLSLLGLQGRTASDVPIPQLSGGQLVSIEFVGSTGGGQDCVESATLFSPGRNHNPSSVPYCAALAENLLIFQRCDTHHFS
ncbi:hypothetical protein ACO22_04542 [Paracoccidioides brasiliensis]|uniref:ABC transporter domain-containing protein n=1 Tax=Paracoccidioides brasiliensis TaxID=121759 RepID=A0A1D2JCR5_PARBR|nr:hypothetical protein ACO22_04542 [Paracoccidioides brasiliensis]